MGCKTITRGCNTLSETVGYVVGTEETDENIPQMERHERKDSTRDRGKCVVLETHKGPVATGKRRTGVTCARCCSPMKWTTPTTTAKSPLQYSPGAKRIPVVPRFADLGIEEKVRLLVGEIADRDEGKEGWEEEKHVDRENRARVQQYPSDSYHRSEQK